MFILSLTQLSVMHPKFGGKLRDVKINQQSLFFNEHNYKSLELGEITWRNGSVRYATSVELEKLENVMEMVCNADDLDCHNNGYCKPWAKYQNTTQFYRVFRIKVPQFWTEFSLKMHFRKYYKIAVFFLQNT